MLTYLTWTPVKFGKHKGKTLPHIILTDPSWFYWAFGDGIFRDELDEQAADISCKACYIKIPKPDPENWRVEYKFSPDWRLLDFFIIDSKAATAISSNSTISTHLDLSLPRILGIKNEKTIGYDLILAKIRDYYFNGSKLTKEKCENFFYDSQNFIWRF